MIPKNPSLPWTQCRGDPGDPPHGLAHLCVAVRVPWPAGLHECGTPVLWQLLAAAGERFVHAVSVQAPCSGNPSAAYIHPLAPIENNKQQQEVLRENICKVREPEGRVIE